MIQPVFEILNQRGTPMFFSDTFANRPSAGIVGRIFISTDTYAFYRDTGTGWDLIGGPGTGTITGSGTIGTLPIWNGTQVIGDSSLLEGASKFTTTKDFQADGYYLSGMTAGSGALYWTSDRVTIANYNATGNVVIEVGGGQNAQTISGTNLSTTFFGNIIRNGGLSTQFLKADGSLDSNTYNTGSGAASQVAFWSATNALSGENNLWWDSVNNYLGINTNTPSVALDVHHGGTNGAILNQTTATNNNLIAFQTSGTGRWRIGNFYNGGADDYGIFDVVGNIQPFTIAKTTGQTFIGSKITASGRLVINSASSDAHIQVVGANAPSIRIDNAGTGATQRFVMGLATATNNFIQGSTAGDICISTASASPLLFGMWQSINASEVMRLSTANNVLIGTSVDSGQKLVISGTCKIGTIDNDTNDLVFFANTNRTTHIGNAFGGTFIQNNVYFNGASYVFDDNTSPSSLITLSGGAFSFQNGAANTSPTTKFTIDLSGNIGLGVTPSAWSGYTGFQIGTQGSIGATSTVINLGQNVYYGSGGNSYIANGKAALYQMNDGEHNWRIAGTGTAGNPITFTQAMTLDASGRLGIGTTAPSGYGLGGKFVVAGLSSGFYFFDSSNQLVLDGNGTPRDLSFYFRYSNSATILSDSNLIFKTTFERARITDIGNFLIGTTTDSGDKLRVSGTGFFSGTLTAATYLSLAEDGSYPGTYYTLGFSGITNGANRIFASRTGSDGIYIASATSRRIHFRPGGTATNLITITDDGNLLINTETNNGEKLQVLGTSRFTTFMGVGTAPDASTMLYVKGTATSTDFAAVFQNSAGTNLVRFFNNGKVNMSSLPTSSSGLSAGDIWNDAGTLKIV